MKAPAFQWYPADYLADMRVRMLSWASRGLYVDLLCYCWREGWIPSDGSAIAQLTGCHDSATIEPCLALFEIDPADPARLFSKRLNEEREKQAAHRKERSESGARGARKRWGNAKDATATPQAPKADSSAIKKPIAPDASSSSPSSSPLVPFGGTSEKRTLATAEEAHQLLDLDLNGRRNRKASAGQRTAGEMILQSGRDEP